MGQSITGVARGNFGTLIVFKNKSISIVEPYTGASIPFYKYLFTDGVGCVSHQSIVYIPGGNLMWWDTDDIYMLLGNQVISATIHPKTKKPRLTNFFRNNVNQARLQFVCGGYYPQLGIVRWFFPSPSSNTNDSHIDYHVKTRSWWPGTLRGTSCCRRIVNGQERFYAGDTNGFVYRHDSGYTDDGTGIPWNFQIPWQVLEGVHIRKKLDMLYAILQFSGTYSVLADIYTNQNLSPVITNAVLSQGSITGAQFDSAKWDQSVFANNSQTLVEASTIINYLCKTVSAKIHGTNSDVPVNLLKLLLTERPLEITRGL